MKLTSFTDYTLRTLTYLAIHGERQATIADIAKAYRISESHLTKVVHQLGRAGDIETVRGKGGGLRLKRAPGQINLGALVRRTEPDMDIVPCFEGSDTCMISKACVLQAALHDALAAFLAVLDRYTLADLIAPRQNLMTLLQLDVVRADRSATPTVRMEA